MCGASCFPVFSHSSVPEFSNNEGAVRLAQNSMHTPNLEHVDIRHHFLRKVVFRGEFSTIPVESEVQHADFLTKLLSRKTFCFHPDFFMSI